MSTVDVHSICPRCQGHTDFKTPQCDCPDRPAIEEGLDPWPRPSSQEPLHYGKRGNKDEPPPPPCPKCKKTLRTRIWRTRQDGVHFFCSDCGWMERDPDNVKFKAKFCDKCGRVPIASVFFDMPEEKTLVDSMLRWQCCGTTAPVWPNEVKFWCHVYIGLEDRDE